MIELANVSKAFEGQIVLNDFSVKIETNEFVTIVGKSGSGKSTLLHIMSMIDKPNSGTVRFLDWTNPKGKDLLELRRCHFGYVFQNYVLMNNKTVKENLLLSTKYTSSKDPAALVDYLEKVQLSKEYLNKKVYQLSGGEQQRLAIARILLKPCTTIFADEPTGNLDNYNKNIILSLFKELKAEGKTIICATHDREIANQSDRTISL
ncbi:putative ABC transport system ATP-binding protein [Alkalibaculum bacchi]|uniref:Putative ABC transport system ATP-binding protein n=1 Tax=Alkalibaculum bacchi TaxID=645887 RepID=A0A366HZQ5_9FIRM|nr:ABC transporter ATP-binding protein [Alkalibaculum bacchi]RBP58761.1 putative ABC transport system ATP-binding protein [Alkalibaculum bacchi]